MTAYRGIDYSHGLANVDKTNGIRYGVISQNSLDQDVINDVVMNGADYGTPHCPKCGNDAITIPSHTESSDPVGQWVSVIQDVPANYEEYKVEEHSCSEYACENCEYLFGSESAFSDEMIGWSHDSNGYKLTQCLDNDVFVIESPFYTYAQFCSPCVPGAGNLDSPLTDGADENDIEHVRVTMPKVYALGHEWFESNKAPYRVFRVSDDSEVAI